MIMLSLAGAAGATDRGEPATWVDALKLALGVLLLLVGVRQWHGRPREAEEVATPKWTGALDTFTSVKAFGAGVLLSGLNPKNLLRTIAGATAIVQTGIAIGSQIRRLRDLRPDRGSRRRRQWSSTSHSASARGGCSTA